MDKTNTPDPAILEATNTFARNVLKWADTPGTVEDFPGVARANLKVLASLLLSKLRAPVADERAAFARAEISFPMTIPGNRVYLAGPMTGYENHNFPAFHAAAERLRASGLEVVNPADHGLVSGLGWADYMRWDLVKLAGCHSVYVLPGWEKSKGASLEVAIAQALGMLVFTVDGAPVLASAPVADERAAFEMWATGIAEKYDVTRNGDHYMEPYTEWVWEAWQARAALASAPVAGEAQPVAWRVVAADGRVRITYYETPDEARIIAAAFDGDTIVPMFDHPAPQASACVHVWEARPMDGSTRAAAPSVAVCRKCGKRGGDEVRK